MKNRGKIFIFTLGNIVALGSFAMSYKVQTGDTLSDIAYRFLGEKVYGPKGGLAKLLSINPQIKNPNIVRLGEDILINKKVMAKKSKKKTDRSIASVQDKKESPQESPENYVLKREEEKPKIQGLYVSLFTGIASISSEDSTSGRTERAVSNMGYGATAVWTHHWSDTLKYFAVGSIKSFKFKMGEGRTLSDAQQTQSYIGTGLTYKPGKHSYSLGVGVGESFILNSVSAGTEFSIKKASIPSVSVSGMHPLASFKSGFSFALGWRAGYLLAAKQEGYSTKAGHYFNAGIGSNYNLNGTILNIQTSYTQRQLEIETATQKSKEFGVSLGVGWSF